MTREVSRQELYEMVWAEPMTILAPKLGISDVGLAKACKKSDIPVPPRGYWAKLQAGKKAARLRLPARGLGMSDRVQFGSQASRSSILSIDDMLADIPPAPIYEESLEAVEARLGVIYKKRNASNAGLHTHAAIARLLAEDEQRREKQRADGFLSTFHAPLFVTPFEQRRLRVFNRLFAVLSGAGFPCAISGKHALEASVRIGDQYVRFRLDSPGSSDVQDRLFGPRTAPKTMDLELTIVDGSGVRSAWRDEKDERLENLTREIAIQLMVQGERACREAAVWRRQWLLERKTERELELIRKEEERLRKESERVVAAEKASLDALLRDAWALRNANEIRAYVDAVRRVSRPDPVTDDWCAWALGEADKLDPVLSGAYLAARLVRGA